ncbi:MAG: family 78 glycoside hydrolase catalytic domain [Williamsia sp.]|nr:family 78 glycoside hydrolase catalytic domain [Williamsia sp.]
MHLNIPFFLVLLTCTATHLFGQSPDTRNRLQAPGGLMCDLLSYTEYQSVDGYPTRQAGKGTKTQAVKISNQQPAFSWIIHDPKQGSMQSAYQVLVSDNPLAISHDTGNIWNSGKVFSSLSSAVLYNGNPLQPDRSYYWKVKVWNNQQEESPFSYPAGFVTDSQLKEYATAYYPVEKSDQQPEHITRIKEITRADFGKDAFGQLKVQLSSGNQHDSVVIRLGEAINPDGSINQKPGGTIRFAQYTLHLLPGTHTYQLSITPDSRNTRPNAITMPDYIGEVTPFRYCEIESYQRPLTPSQLVRAVAHYPFNDSAAHFSSSDTLLNKIWDLCKYTVKATSFTGIYIDGDRERIPYEADAYINQLCHYSVDREYSMARRSHEYLIHHANWPTEWILQSVLMAWNDYLYTGDLRSAHHFYEELKKKTLVPLEDANGLITAKKTTPELLKQIHLISTKEPHGLEDIVDWPHTGILGLGNNEGGETDGFVFTDYNAVVNAYYYRALVIMGELAAGLGKKEDASFFADKAARLRKIYHKLFYDPKQGVFCDGITTRHASLHTNVFALTFGLAEEKEKGSLVAFIRSRGMACSVYGSQFLLDAVYDGGDEDYGLALLTATNERSWYNMIKVGSTLTLEAWDNKFKPNQDWNHVWGAAPANIIPRKLMGIEPLKPGWTRFTIAPKPGTLRQAAIKVPTIKGDVVASFENAASSFTLQATIPSNTMAQVYLPARKEVSKVLMDGTVIKPTKTLKGLLIQGVGSGVHTFTLAY